MVVQRVFRNFRSLHMCETNMLGSVFADNNGIMSAENSMSVV